MSVSTSLQVYYPCDEASGDLLDAVGTYHLTETSGTVDATTGKVAGGRDYEAGDTEYHAAASAAVVEFGDEDFSVAFWVKPESVGTGADYVSKFTASDYLVGDDGTGKPRFLVRDAANTANVALSSSTTLSAGTWYFIVARHDAANNTLDIRVNDGTLDSVSHSGGVLKSSTAFVVGARPGGSRYADGVLDEIGIWRKVLTDAESTWLYNAGSGRSYAAIVAGMTTRHALALLGVG